MIGKDKKYKTRDGAEVIIYNTGANGDFPVHGAWKQGDLWVSDEWSFIGEYLCKGRGPSPKDLIEVKYGDGYARWVDLNNLCDAGTIPEYISPPSDEQPTTLSLTQHGTTITIQHPSSDIDMEEMSNLITRLVYGSGYSGETLVETLIQVLTEWTEE
jgi:hypothetical protein